MKLKHIVILYIVSTIAFLFALLKYFASNVSVSVVFVILEIFSFIGFIGIIYLSDKIIRNSNKLIEDKEKEFQNKEEGYIQSIDEYKRKLSTIQIENNREKSETEIGIISEEISVLVSNSSDLKTFANQLLSKLSKHYEIGLGVCYFKTELSDNYAVQGVYGLKIEEVQNEIYELNGINGECISRKEAIIVNEIDEDYFNIESCSGLSKPKHIYLLPIVINDLTVGIIELATFKKINIENHWDSIGNAISELKVL